MITTVTLNPAIDKIVEINHMRLGHVHRISKTVKALGGKSINVARILSGLNVETKAICFAGKDNLDEVLSHATHDLIPLDPIVIEGVTRTNIKIAEPDNNYQTTDINEAGFNITQEQLTAMTEKIVLFAKKSEFVIISGSLPEGVPLTYYRELAIKLKPYTKVVIDADNKILASALEGSPFLIKPNIHELESAVGVTIENEEDIINVCRTLITTYDISYILVSMGEKGSILVSESIIIKSDILPVKVVSTVGAGDAMLGGFVYGLLQYPTQPYDEHQLKLALSYAVASSSIAISTQNHVSIQYDQLITKSNEVKMYSISGKPI
jgi:1-phosphofructokinase